MQTRLQAITLLAATLALGACGGGGGGNSGPITTGAACGNGEINGVELCDGAAFVTGADCADYGLDSGQVTCSATCTLDFASCSYQDYCTANDLYSNGACDACDLLGGVRDPECDTLCGADGTCGDTWEPLVGAWTCSRLGLVDPDCGVCGNRILEGNEVCDGSAFDPTTFRCDAFGYYGGTMACGPNCQPDFSGCLASDCGDGMIEGDEECDGADVAGKTCADYGGVAGDVTCTAECKLDATTCVSPGCNNGVLEAPIEACDGALLGDATCESRGFVAGTLACTDSCSFDESGCIAPGCGNGIKEPNEDCEIIEGETNLYGATCESEGFLPEPSVVSCNFDDCTYDTSLCVAAGCGNGVVEAPVEDCEGDDTRACTDIGFDSGTSTCDGCKWNDSACVGGCGNGVKDGDDQCDGADLGGASCESLGFESGTLSCSATCQHLTTACVAAPVGCGDGIRQPGEICDGAQILNGLTCAAIDAGTGTMACGDDCVPDLSGCSAGDGDYCAAGGFYGDDVCDPCAAWGGTADSDCNDCGADGACVGYWGDIAGYADTCEVSTGQRDPDCVSMCGNGEIDVNVYGLAIEPCDGAAFHPSYGTCQKFGFTGGTLKCTSCHLDFSSCN